MSTNHSVLSVHLMPSSFLNGDTNGGKDPFIENGYASTGFQIVCSALVMIMTPCVGILYASFAHPKNILTTICISVLAYCVVAIQWILFGFSLAFSETSSLFLGDFFHFLLLNVDWSCLPTTAPALPAIVFCLYQMQFATITAALIFGSVIERVRILPSLIFMFVWTTAVYDPIIFWTWSARGWIRNMSCPSSAVLGNTPCGIGAIDFAGGGPIHIASGAASLAFCIFVGPRKGWLESRSESKPKNMIMSFAATIMLWFGWFGFNAGSALDATPRAGYAGVLTVVAASSGALVWTALDYRRHGKISIHALSSGAIAGLVGITPASGFVPIWSSVVIGALTAVSCFYGVQLKLIYGYDDSADSFGVHGIGGFVGSIMTAVFASKHVASLDATAIPGGPLIDGEFAVLLYNSIAALIILLYSYLGTFAILTAIEWSVPLSMRFRLSEQEEEEGQDINQLGESLESEGDNMVSRRSKKFIRTHGALKTNEFIELQDSCNSDNDNCTADK